MHYYYYDHNLTATTTTTTTEATFTIYAMHAENFPIPPSLQVSHSHKVYPYTYIGCSPSLTHSLLLLTTILYLGNITYSHTRFAIYLRLQERRKIKMRIERDRQRASERETENGILCRACSPKSAPHLNKSEALVPRVLVERLGNLGHHIAVHFAFCPHTHNILIADCGDFTQ